MPRQFRSPYVRHALQCIKTAEHVMEVLFLCDEVTDRRHLLAFRNVPHLMRTEVSIGLVANVLFG